MQRQYYMATSQLHKAHYVHWNLQPRDQPPSDLVWLLPCLDAHHAPDSLVAGGRWCLGADAATPPAMTAMPNNNYL